MSPSVSLGCIVATQDLVGRNQNIGPDYALLILSKAATKNRGAFTSLVVRLFHGCFAGSYTSSPKVRLDEIGESRWERIGATTQ
jgi:hypothetical protein